MVVVIMVNIPFSKHFRNILRHFKKGSTFLEILVQNIKMVTYFVRGTVVKLRNANLAGTI